MQIYQPTLPKQLNSWHGNVIFKSKSTLSALCKSKVVFLCCVRVLENKDITEMTSSANPIKNLVSN